MKINILKLFLMLCIILTVIGCSHHQTENMELQQSTSIVCNDSLHDYIVSDNDIIIVDNLQKSSSKLKEDNIIGVWCIDEALYFIAQSEDSYILKKWKDNMIESIYTIPLENVKWCEMWQNNIYVYSEDTFYFIDVLNPYMNLLKANVTAQHITLNDNYIYYNEVNMTLPDEKNLENILSASLGQKIKMIDIVTGEISTLYSHEESGNIYFINQILAYSDYLLFYQSGGSTYKDTIFLIDENKELQPLRTEINTNIDYLATDGTYVYYVESETKKILRTSINNKKTTVIYDYSDYDVKYVLGMTFDNIYFADKEDNIIQYNIRSKSTLKIN